MDRIRDMEKSQIEPITRIQSLAITPSQRRYDLSRFKQIFKKGKYALGIEKNLDLLRKLLSPSNIIDGGDENRIESLLGTILRKMKSMEKIGVDDIRLIKSGLDFVDFPKDPKELFGDHRWFTQDHVNERIPELVGYVVNSVDEYTGLSNTTEPLTIERPIYRYAKIKGGYGFFPVSLFNMGNMPNKWMFDVKHKVIHPPNLSIEDGKLTKDERPIETIVIEEKEDPYEDTDYETDEETEESFS
jgi:hypothetical protein